MWIEEHLLWIRRVFFIKIKHIKVIFHVAHERWPWRIVLLGKCLADSSIFLAFQREKRKVSLLNAIRWRFVSPFSIRHHHGCQTARYFHKVCEVRWKMCSPGWRISHSLFLLLFKVIDFSRRLWISVSPCSHPYTAVIVITISRQQKQLNFLFRSLTSFIFFFSFVLCFSKKPE